MKHLNLLFFILAAGLLMTSCKKDDAKKTPENELIGKWVGEKTITSISVNGSVLESDTSLVQAPDYFRVEFKKNNQCFISTSFENEIDSENLFYKVEGDKLTLGEDEQYSDPEIYSFKLNGKKLILMGTETEESNGATWLWKTEIHFSK